MASVVIYQLPIEEACVQSQVRLCRICSGQSGNGADFSEYFGFPCKFSFHLLLHTHLSSRDATIDSAVTDVRNGLNLSLRIKNQLTNYIEQLNIWFCAANINANPSKPWTYSTTSSLKVHNNINLSFASSSATILYTSANVKNTWIYRSTTSYAFMV
jgi:hypothetical protein